LGFNKLTVDQQFDGVFRDPSLVGRQADRVDIARMVEQVPELASAFIGLAQRHHMLQEEYALMVDRIHGDTQPATLAPLPHEIVRDFFNRRNNHIDSLDRLAEALAAELQLRPGERVAALREALRKQHRIELIRLEEVKDGILRQFDERRRRLGIASGLSDAQQSFQIATQFALIAHQEVIDAEIAAAGINEAQGQALARQGLAHYFAGALLMPYADFLDAARREKYDIEALQRRFAVGFESVCHRLSTLQRSGAAVCPFTWSGWIRRATSPSGKVPPPFISPAMVAHARSGMCTMPSPAPARSSLRWPRCPTDHVSSVLHAPSAAVAAATVPPGNSSPLAWAVN
jgi:hypothetical protein